MLGNTTECIKKVIKKDVFCIIDSQMKGVSLEGKDNCKCINFFDEQELESCLESVEDVQSVTVYVSADYGQDYDKFFEEMNTILTRLVIVSKEIYKLAMFNRNLKVWYINLIDGQKSSAHQELTEALSGGISTMAKVLGLEVSKKKLHANYVKVTDIEKTDDLVEFIEQLSTKDMYLNLQDITI